MQPPSRSFAIRQVAWADAGPALSAVRRRVFVEEQGVPEELEWDGRDPACDHVLALSVAGEPIGTARLLPDGHVGRMAVLAGWRGRGIGTAMLRALLDRARQAGHPVVALNAQVAAIGFYRRLGFVAHGGEFLDAGIPHVRMSLRFETPAQGSAPASSV